VTPQRLSSLKETLQRAARKKKIILPEPIKRIKNGETARYRPEDLYAEWAEYQKVLPVLPDLKPLPSG